MNPFLDNHALLLMTIATQTTSNITSKARMNNTTGNAIIEGLFIAGVVAGLISVYHVIKSCLKPPKIENSKPKFVARKRAPTIHIGLQQAHEFAAAYRLVDGDLGVKGSDVYRVSREELQGGSWEITYGRCYPFAE